MRCVAGSDEVVINDKFYNTDVLSHPNILMIGQANIARFVGVDCFDIHIG